MEPVTFTAATIASFAFAKFLETATERYSEAALDKIDELRQKLWERLRGHPKAEKEMQAIESGEKTELSRLSTYLEDVMEDDSEFAALIQTLAKEIEQGKRQEQTQMIQNINDQGRGIQQVRVEGGNPQVAAEIKNYYGNSPD